MKSTTLYYREGSSDKIYQVSLAPAGGLFLVNFAYGRRGSSLNTGSKTAAPVDLPAAEKLFDKLVREKKAKGYTEGPDGAPYQGNNAVEHTGLAPQLLNPAPEEDLPRYLADPLWCLQEKFDGKRMLLRKQGGQVGAINRRGLTTGVAAAIVQELERFPEDCLLDGEAVGERHFAFDLLECGGRCLRALPYDERLQELEALLARAGGQSIQAVATARETQAKEALLRDLRGRKAEGVALKRLDAPWAPGRPASGGPQLKHKFHESASCLVEAVNPGKRSVRLALFSAGQKVEAGNVTIPPDAPMPEPGIVVEVRYLYAFRESGALFQPVFLGPRGDIAPEECATSQLKYRAETAEEDEEGALEAGSPAAAPRRLGRKAATRLLSRIQARRRWEAPRPQ